MAFNATKYATFRNYWRYKKITGWSNGGGQCVDEVRKYMQQVLGCRTNTLDWIAGGNASDFYNNASTRHFKKVRNSSNNFPPEGAIVVANHLSKGLDGRLHNFGHVFVANKDCTSRYLRGFGQNWTIYRHCQDEYHPHYTDNNWSVIGWLIAL